jgi:hypothetical protein
MYINIIHHKKIHPRIPSTTLVLKYIFKFSNFVMGIILSQICFIHSKFSMFVEFLNRWSKANQIYLKQEKIIQNVMSIHYQKN